MVFTIIRPADVEPDDHLEWLALMQHHGTPTRLLDWTESPYVAPYFASVWLFNPGTLENFYTAVADELNDASISNPEMLKLTDRLRTTNLDPLDRYRAVNMLLETDRVGTFP